MGTLANKSHINSLKGLDLYDMYGSNHNCQKGTGIHCSFCKANKVIYQRLYRFVFGRHEHTVTSI